MASAVSASAATLTVNAGGNLQAAIDAAHPGDTIILQAGATFDGPFKLRVKGGSTPIVIRSSSADALLPASGERITPAAAPLLAKIRSTTAGPAVRTDPGATYWTLRFLEFLPTSSNSSATLVAFGGTGTDQNTLSAVPQHLILDRCYLHGNASFGQRRGLALNSGDTQVINSYFSDIKANLQDTQAIMGWNGPGPYLIENNYLEAAGENVMFGGSDASIPNLVPSNITMRRNLISRPLAWMSQSWTVKNLLEFKNAQDVLVEGNTLENHWAAGQSGYAILFTPRNQSGNSPWSVVRNITIRSNVIRHVSAVFNISGWDDIYTSRQTENIVIQNNLVYDVSTAYSIPGHPANGWFAIAGNAPKNVTFEHNTVDHNGSNLMRLFGGVATDGVHQILGLVVNDNSWRVNTYGIAGDSRSQGSDALNFYAPGAQVLTNAFAGGNAKIYPTGNDFPTVTQWLADFVSEGTANYQLTAASPLRHAAGDGTDIGVDFTALNAALAGTPASGPPPPPPPPPDGSSPYSGTPVTLPGTVQFENYDAGGANVAYYDTTASNLGGVYRSNAVDIKATTDAGGGYLVGWTTAGEWLNYTVNVAAAGTYAIDVRVASSGVGGRFHIEVDGVDKTGAIAVPNTGGWQTWQTVTKSGVTLAAGTHVMKVAMDAIGPSGSVANFNWFAVTSTSGSGSTPPPGEGGSTPYTGTPVPVPGTVQFERYDGGGLGVAYSDTTSGNAGGVYRSNWVDIKAATDSGGGYLVGWTAAGEWLKYTVKVAAAATYAIDVRVASSGVGGTFHIEVNGVDKTGPISVPNTGGWQTWKTLTKTGVSLAAGTQVVRVVMDAIGPSGSVANFNWFAVR
ncbi:MAG: carbohydrate-binding protein [Vicinamibacterales bacterium]